jgi:hypothetical protein
MSDQSKAPAGGRWLAGQVLARPHLLGVAGRVIAAGDRSNDACLDARQFLEHQLGADPKVTLTLGDYRHAVNALYSAGMAAGGDILDAIAPTGAELGGAARAWQARYAQRQPTADERFAASRISRGEVIVKGEQCLGIDGAGYARAYYPHSGKPAIVVTFSGGTREIVNFANRDDAWAWMTARAPEASGPLRTTATGPGTRTTREEEVLAFLLRDPMRAAPVARLLAPGSMTTHLRAEALAAWRKLAPDDGGPQFEAVATWYGRSLLRAPRWAADEIGWPGASRAMAYLDRLTATPVTESQARVAAEFLAFADAGGQAHHGHLPQFARAQRAPLLPAPVPAAARTGPAPRLP